MASKSNLPYAARASGTRHPLARRLFHIAQSKNTNLVVSADLTTTAELLRIVDKLGPYIAVVKTHIDIISDFGHATIEGLQRLSEKHNFLIFEDRKFVDIGNIVQKQYEGGILRISDWAHIVNASVLAGPGIIQALDEVIVRKTSHNQVERGVLILAEMTPQGNLAKDEYTKLSVNLAQEYPNSVFGFVATRQLGGLAHAKGEYEDFVVFTTGVNIGSKGDSLGQQYQTPTTAVEGGSDFLICGRGLYAASDPVAAAEEYRAAGWEAYQKRIKSS